MSLEADLREIVRDEAAKAFAAWEQAQPRPRMIPLREAAALLGVCDKTLRELAPRLPIIVDKTSTRHSVSSVHVYAVITAGGIEAVLDTKPAARKGRAA